MALTRYPGVTSFQDDDISSQLFFGRKDDCKNLLYFILSEQLTILFSKSGYGKTSLLQARIFKELRAEKYFPLTIRFNKKGLSPQVIIRSEIKSINDTTSFEVISNDEAGDLKDFFHDLEIWSSDDKLFTPVIIFDQFEEIFTLEHNLEHRALFFEELSQVINQTKEGRRFVKIVISIREDFLGHLEKLSVKIPSIFTNRFRLEPLTLEGAEEAIVKPGQLELKGVKFQSPQFSFSADAKKDLLHFLSLKLMDGNMVVSNEVEPIQLQIICSELEDRIINNKIKADQHDKIIINEKDLGKDKGMKEMLENFYTKQLGKLISILKLNDTEVIAVRNILEKELITGKRRVPIDYDTVLKRGVRKDAIEFLITNKLLKIENYQGNHLVEISHDTLVEPILHTLEQREIEEAKILNEKQLIDERIKAENALIEASKIAEENKTKLRRVTLFASLLILLIVVGVFFAIKSYQANQKMMLANLKSDSLAKEARFSEEKAKKEAVRANEEAGRANDLTKKAKKEEVFAKQDIYLTTATISQKTNPTLSYLIARRGLAIDTSNVKLKNFISGFEGDKYAFITNSFKVSGKVSSAFMNNQKLFINTMQYKYVLNRNGLPESSYDYGNLGENTYSIGYRCVNGKQLSIVNIENGTAKLLGGDNRVISEFNIDTTAQNSDISNNGKYYVIGDGLYRINKKDTLRTFSLWPGLRGTMATIFSNDGKYIVSAHWTSHILIQDTLGKIVKVFKHGGTNSVTSSLAVTDNFKYLVSTNRSDRNAKIWEIGNLGNEKNLTVDMNYLYVLKGHTASVNCVAISHDNKYILTGSDDNTAILWNFKGENLSILKGHKGKVTSVSFSPDDKELITGSEDGEVLIWRIGGADKLYKENKLVQFSPFDYASLGLSEFVENNVYNTNGLKNMYLSALNYLNSIPETNAYPQDKSYLKALENSINQVDSLCQKIFKSKYYKDSIDVESRKFLLLGYSNLMFKKPSLLLIPKKSGLNADRQFGERDIMAARACLIDTNYITKALFYAEDLITVSENCRIGKNYGLSLKYAFAEKDLIEAFYRKNPSNKILADELYKAYNNISLIYLYNFKAGAPNLTQARNFAQKALTLNVGIYNGSFLLLTSYLLSGSYDEAVKRFEILKKDHPKPDLNKDYSARIATMNGNGLTHPNLKKFKDYLEK